MRGRVITPGEATDLSAYRCKLAGILAAITVTNTLARFHAIKTELTIQCDCISGLEKAFGHSAPSLQDPSHDLMKAIHDEIKNLLIKWKWQHIKGHQDDTTPFNDLDRPSQLNVLVDCMAKEVITIAMDSPRHYDLCSNSWSLKLGNIPNITNIDKTIYDIIYTPAVK
jgi:hypothetical protein